MQLVNMSIVMCKYPNTDHEDIGWKMYIIGPHHSAHMGSKPAD